jgi:hypothetical protein
VTPAAVHAASPKVEAQVVDRAGRVIGPRTVRLDALRVRSEGRTCRLRAGLALAALRELRVPFRVEGSCPSLYVFEARRQRERGAGGWVYKVDRRLPGVSASATSGRLRSGRQVTWFWCVQAGNCQRSLETRSVAEGGSLRVTVTAYDDKGRGIAAAGADVTVTTATGERSSAVTAADGTASLPVGSGAVTVNATRRGLVPSFPERVAAR